MCIRLARRKNDVNLLIAVISHLTLRNIKRQLIYYRNTFANTRIQFFFLIIFEKNHKKVIKKKVYANVVHDDLSILVIEFSFPCLRYVFYRGATRVYEVRDSAFTLETF